MVEVLMTTVMFIACFVYMVIAIKYYKREKRRVWVKGEIVGVEWGCIPKIKYSYNNNTYCVVNENLKTTQYFIKEDYPVGIYLSPSKPDDISFKKNTFSTFIEMLFSTALTVFFGMHFVYMYDFSAFEIAMHLVYITVLIVVTLLMLKEARNVSKDLEKSIPVEGVLLNKKVKSVSGGLLVEALVKYDFDGVRFCSKIIEKVVTVPLDSDAVTILVNRDYPDRFHIEPVAENIRGSRFLLRFTLFVLAIAFVLRLGMLFNTLL